MKRIAFFGGSFNPPTYAHINIAYTTLKQLKIDKFFFVPVGNLYNKPDLIDEKDRYNMLKLVCNQEKNIDVEDIELNKSKSFSAIEVFDMIKKKYQKNDTEIFFVMGADNFIKINTWQNFNNLIKDYKYIVIQRDNIDLETFISNNICKDDKNNIDILKLKEYTELRSSIIRNLSKSGNFNEAKQYTKPEVIEYIEKNKLYF